MQWECSTSGQGATRIRTEPSHREAPLDPNGAVPAGTGRHRWAEISGPLAPRAAPEADSQGMRTRRSVGCLPSCPRLYIGLRALATGATTAGCARGDGHRVKPLWGRGDREGPVHAGDRVGFLCLVRVSSDSCRSDLSVACSSNGSDAIERPRSNLIFFRSSFYFLWGRGVTLKLSSVFL